MDCAALHSNMRTSAAAECVAPSSSTLRALSSLSSSTSSLLPAEIRRRHPRSHSRLIGLQLRDGFAAAVRSVQCRGSRRSFTKGDKESLPPTFFLPSSDSYNPREGDHELLLWDDNHEEAAAADLRAGDTIRPGREDDDPARNQSSKGDDDKGTELGLSQSHDSPLDSRVEDFEGIPVTEWLLKFVGSVSPRIRGIILLNMLTFLYGSNISVIKESEALLDPASFSVGRFVIAALVFAPFMKGGLKDPYVAKAGLELGVWSSLGYLTQALGLMTTDAGRASFFTTFTVIVVPLFAGFMGKKIPVLTWFAAVAALFGVGLLETSGAPPTVGDAWNLVSAVVFGVHMLRTELHSRAVSRNEALPIIALQLSVITASAFMWSLASHLTAGDALPDLLSLDWPGLYETALQLPWFAMLYTGLFSTAFCLSGELLAMRDVSATEAAVITTLEPLWGAAFAWFLLGERWGLRGWVGAAFILGGSAAMQIWGSPEVPVTPLKTPVPRVEASDLETKALINPLAEKRSE